MVKGCGGHSTLDALLFRHSIVVCYCVVEESQLPVPSSMAAVGMVLDGDRWCTV